MTKILYFVKINVKLSNISALLFRICFTNWKAGGKAVPTRKGSASCQGKFVVAKKDEVFLKNWCVLNRTFYLFLPPLFKTEHLRMAWEKRARKSVLYQVALQRSVSIAPCTSLCRHCSRKKGLRSNSTAADFFHNDLGYHDSSKFAESFDTCDVKSSHRLRKAFQIFNKFQTFASVNWAFRPFHQTTIGRALANRSLLRCSVSLSSEATHHFSVAVISQLSQTGPRSRLRATAAAATAA